MLAKTVLLSLTVLGSALSQANVKRQATQLRNKYDFVIAGGGTCGLTVADRITEAFPGSRCHVLFFLPRVLWLTVVLKLYL